MHCRECAHSTIKGNYPVCHNNKLMHWRQAAKGIILEKDEDQLGCCLFKPRNGGLTCHNCANKHWHELEGGQKVNICKLAGRHGIPPFHLETTTQKNCKKWETEEKVVRTTSIYKKRKVVIRRKGITT